MMNMHMEPAVEMLIYYNDSQRRYPDSKYDFLKKAYSSAANIIITDESILLKRDEKVIKFVYECRYLKQDGVDKGVVLSVYYDNFPSSSLDTEVYFLLEALIKKLQSTKEEGIIVTKIWDKSSYVLCNKAYEPLAHYERLLKKLTNLAFCKISTTDWAEDFIEETNKIWAKKRINEFAENYSDKREIIIEVLDFPALYEIVFGPESDKSKGVNRKDKACVDKHYLWDDLTRELSYLKGFKGKAEELVPLRNKVMHSNTLLLSEYYQIIALCRDCNNLLNRAIKDIDMVTISPSSFECLPSILPLVMSLSPLGLVAGSILSRRNKSGRRFE